LAAVNDMLTIYAPKMAMLGLCGQYSFLR